MNRGHNIKRGDKAALEGATCVRTMLVHHFEHPTHGQLAAEIRYDGKLTIRRVGRPLAVTYSGFSNRYATRISFIRILLGRFIVENLEAKP